jgi:hypothetical protein
MHPRLIGGLQYLVRYEPTTQRTLLCSSQSQMGQHFDSGVVEWAM